MKKVQGPVDSDDGKALPFKNEAKAEDWGHTHSGNQERQPNGRQLGEWHFQA